MLLYFSKLGPLLVFPLGLALLLLAAALILRRRLRLRTTCEVLAILVLFLFSNQWVAYRLAGTLENQYTPPDAWPDRATVVILGGGTRVREAPRPLTELNEAGDRLIFGLWLYREGIAERIIVTGGSIAWLGSTTSEASGMQQLLTLMGVDAARIYLEDQARNTYENAVYTRALLEELHAPDAQTTHATGSAAATCTPATGTPATGTTATGTTATGATAAPIILVTSAMHMPRSVAIFEHQGFIVLPAPVDYVVTRGDPNRVAPPDLAERFLHLLPSVEYLEISTRVIREYIGLIVYRVLGRL